MGRFKIFKLKYAAIILGLLFVLALVSFSYANHREIRILSVTVGTGKIQAENWLGKAMSIDDNGT